MAEKCGDEEARFACPGPPQLQSQGKVPWRRVCNIYYLEQDLLTRSSQGACDIKLTYCFFGYLLCYRFGYSVGSSPHFLKFELTSSHYALCNWKVTWYKSKETQGKTRLRSWRDRHGARFSRLRRQNLTCERTKSPPATQARARQTKILQSHSKVYANVGADGHAHTGFCTG